MTLNLRTITAAVKALTITGVTIYDVDEIPQALNDPGLHYLYPRPDGFFPAGLQVTVDSFGVNTGAFKTLNYQLRYTFAYRPIGDGLAGLFEYYPSMVDMALLIINTLMENDNLSGAIDIQPGLGAFGIVYDAAGNAWHGCDILINVHEFWEV